MHPVLGLAVAVWWICASGGDKAMSLPARRGCQHCVAARLGGDHCTVILHPLTPLQGKASGGLLGNEQLKLGFGS